MLPFVAFPLIYLTSAEAVMRVRKHPESIEVDVSPDPESMQKPDEDQVDLNTVKIEVDHAVVETIKVADQDQGDRAKRKEFLDYSNGRFIVALSYVIWCIVLVANAYAIVMLFLR